MPLAQTDFGIDLCHCLEAVNKQILSDFNQPTGVAEDSVSAAFSHHFAALGKQTRATLALIAGHHLGLNEADSTRIAACVEILHNASLVQDDLQDRALCRRNQPTIHSLYGEPIALGLTMRLVATAFQSIQSFGDDTTRARLFAHVQKALSRTISGQNRDLEPDRQRSFADLLRIAEDKSGPLFALSLQLPLVAANFTDYSSLAAEAACKFGLGYQMLDDVKDREIDRLQPADSNIVNALMRLEGHDENTAVGEVEALAARHLKTSARLARELPNRSGSGLQALSQSLLDSFAVGHV